ncbi:MAG: 3-oxoacyl-ACP reductase FabG [Clostridia bacterium]|nr:3-oxoacyl-ACP reductase FabG [Clostridia bacterium]
MKKTVVITGGAGGIGSAIARKFAKCGYNVVICYCKSVAKAEVICKELTAFCDILSIYADLKNPLDIKEAAKQIIARFGGADILVNNAGESQIKLFTDFQDSELSDLLDVNLKGAMLLTKTLIPYMVSKKWGRIINIGSMWGSIGASCEVPYSAAKAGLIGFTKALAKELGPSGITVNCVSPGLIDTPMNQPVDKLSIESIIESTPLCRMGTPQDIAEAVYFLASDNAGFITGQTLAVDGGLT